MEEPPTKSSKAGCALQAINQPTDIKLRSELTDDDPRFTYDGATHPNRRPYVKAPQQCRIRTLLQTRAGCCRSQIAQRLLLHPRARRRVRSQAFSARRPGAERTGRGGANAGRT